MRKSIIILGLYIAIIIAGITGEIMCIYKALNCNWDNIGKAEVIYTVSAFTGLGAIVGYFDIEDK